MSPVMSLAASDERCARVRTSAATTAKPLPASPARAASTAALRASRLVWKAISSITPVMSEIFWLACSMRAIASTAVMHDATAIRRDACRLLGEGDGLREDCADAFTEAASSSVVAAVSSSEEACCSVRFEQVLRAGADLCRRNGRSPPQWS